VGRRRLVYPGPVGTDHFDAGELAMLRHPTARAVARAVIDHPNASARELRTHVAMSRRAFYHQLKRMRAAGLVVCQDSSVYRRVSPADRLPHLLHRLQTEGYENPVTY
jgi:DNA-binding transcriptional ArsR family regulator